MSDNPEAKGFPDLDVGNEPLPSPSEELARLDAQEVTDLPLRDQGLWRGWWRREFCGLVTADRDGLLNGCFHGVCTLLVLQSSPSFLPAGPLVRRAPSGAIEPLIISIQLTCRRSATL